MVEIGAGAGPCLAKIAFDPKDSRLPRPKAWEVLNGSLDDRGADYAVLVVATEDNVPAGTQNLVEYEGNKLIVAVDREGPSASCWKLPTVSPGACPRRPQGRPRRSMPRR